MMERETLFIIEVIESRRKALGVGVGEMAFVMRIDPATYYRKVRGIGAGLMWDQVMASFERLGLIITVSPLDGVSQSGVGHRLIPGGKVVDRVLKGSSVGAIPVPFKLGFRNNGKKP